MVYVQLGFLFLTFKASATLAITVMTNELLKVTSRMKVMRYLKY